MTATLNGLPSELLQHIAAPILDDMFSEVEKSTLSPGKVATRLLTAFRFSAPLARAAMAVAPHVVRLHLDTNYPPIQLANGAKSRSLSTLSISSSPGWKKWQKIKLVMRFTWNMVTPTYMNFAEACNALSSVDKLLPAVQSVELSIQWRRSFIHGLHDSDSYRGAREMVVERFRRLLQVFHNLKIKHKSLIIGCSCADRRHDLYDIPFNHPDFATALQALGDQGLVADERDFEVVFESLHTVLYHGRQLDLSPSDT